MSEYTEEEEFIALADGRRKVASPEGADFYGQPIGTWITPDMIKAKKAEKGSAPKGALEQGVSAKSSSSVKGPNKFKVGDAQFSAPKGSTLIKAKSGNLTYIRTPDGEIHAYNSEGEVPIPDSLKDLLKSKFSQNFKGDDLYDIEEFDETNDQKLSDLPLGTQLSKNGIVAFEKKEEKLWENPDLGIQLSDADLQNAFDQGQFEVVAPTTEELDFSKLSEDELSGVLDSYPTGKKLFFGNTTLVKTDNGAWKSMSTGKDTDSAVLAGIAVNTNFLGEKKPVQADDGEDPLETATPEPEAEAPKVYDAAENLVDSDEVWSTDAGESVFHKTKGELIKGTMGEAWYGSDGYSYNTGLVAKSADKGNISSVAWDENQEKALDPDPVISEEVWKLLGKQKKIQAIKQYREDNDLVSLKEAKDVIDKLWDTEQDKIATYAPEPEVVIPDNAPNEYDLTDALPGATVVHDTEGILTMEDDGSWYNKYAEPVFELADLLIENDKGKLTDLKANPEFDENFAADDPQNILAELKSQVPEDANEVATLDYMDTDDEIVVSTTFGQVTFTKQYDGEWFDGESTWFSDDDLSQDVAEGLVYQLKEDEPAPAPKSNEDDSIVDMAGGFMEKTEIQDAIQSLEAHSGFQIKYGLKSLSDEHPLKQQEYLDKVVAEAKEANPNLSPKQALVKHLKDSINQNDGPEEPLADWEKELLEGPYIQIGTEDAKNTATGLTGGAYSKEEIQKAVDLLESFEGKAFKAYLNKNGNKLGELSPNDIVGFNKDKTITKNNFVALLKKKLDDYDPYGEKKDVPKVVVPEPVGDVVIMPTASNKYVPGTKPESNEDLYNAPLGTALTINANGTYHLWVKTNLDSWSLTNDPDGDEDYTDSYGFNVDLALYVNPPSSEDDSEPEVNDIDKLTKAQFKAFPVGKKLYYNGFAYEKTSPYQWDTTTASGNTLDFGDPDVWDSIQANKGWSLTPSENSQEDSGGNTSAPDANTVDSPEVTTPEETDVNTLNVGDKPKSVDQLDALPIGSVITFKSVFSGENDYKKIEDGDWKHTKNSEELSAGAFFNAVASSKVTLKSTPDSPELDAKPLSDGDLIETSGQFANLPVGTVVNYKSGFANDFYTKLESGKWKANFNNSELGDGSFENAIAGKVLFIGSKPTPEVSGPLSKGDKITSQEQVASFPAGTKLGFKVNNADQTLVKLEEGTWQDVSTGQKINADLTPMLPYLTFDSMPGEDNQPEEAVIEPVNGIAPGKYNTGKGAKAHLWVKADGTGIYQGMKGIQKPLDAEGVKKNFDAGMNKLATSDLSAMPGGPESASPEEAKKMIPYLGTVDTLPDGSYQDSNGVEYKVSGNTVSVLKDKKSMDFTSIKVGQTPNGAFLQNAPDGTRIAYRQTATSDPNFMVKTDGEWKVEEGSSPYIENYLNGIYSSGSYYGKRWKVESFPEKDEKTATKASIKTKYLQGTLMDVETRNSVFPPGHSGNVVYAGGPTNVTSLDAWRSFLQNPDNTLQQKSIGHTDFGVPIDPKFLKTRLLAKKGKENFEAQEFIDAIVEDVTEFLSTANVPEKTNPLDLFKKDSLGNPKKPLPFALNTAPSYYDSTKKHSDFIKEISSYIGDGDVIGQGMTGADKDQKINWSNAVKQGNFKIAFNIEQAVAKAKGKPFTPNPLHPGHPLNPDTHKVKWGAAVDGETPAGTPIPGNWTSIGIDASPAEIDNYLILAKMQNPTHLDLNEKRAWVTYHRQGSAYSDTVDHYSALAQKRANDGAVPLSAPPVWTDNVKPSKSWESMFDGTEFPQNWSNYESKGWEYYNDHKDEDPELVKAWNAKKAENSYWDNDDVSAYMLNQWFAQKEAAYLEELNNPVYKVVQQISTGTHPVYIVADQFDRKKIFKPLTPGKEWRAENEVAAHNLAAQLGFNVPNAKIGDVYEGLPMGSNYQGIIMDFAPNVGSFGDIDGAEMDFSTLTEKQVGQLAGEHILDWFLDNDDTHSENILVGEAGEIVAIDKGRAFFQYGHWHGLNVDDPAMLNINTQDSDGKANVYHDMMMAVKNGTFSQAQVDAAYKASTRAAKRISKFDDNAVELFVRSASDRRTTWEVPDYAQNWDVLSAAPQSQDELVAAVLSRKNSMIEDVEDMWTKLYASAGLDKPEAPAKLLAEDLSSGWEEGDLTEKIVNHKVWGVAPVHASPAFTNGASLIWTEKDTNGSSVVSGKFTLGEVTQKKVVQFLSGKVKPGNGYVPTAELNNYPAAHVKQWKKTTTAAGKNVSANATTGDYDNSIIQTMRDTEKLVDADIAFAPQVDTYSKSNVTFPSGVSMPGETVPQYLMALNYHKGLVANVEQAIKEKVATDKNHFKDFEPPQWKINGAKYFGPDNVSYKQLDGGNYVEVKNGIASIVPDIPAAAKIDAPGWTKEVPDAGEESLDPEKYSYNQAGMFAGKLLPGGEKKIESVFSHSGHPGYEYRVDLPGGEKVFFRNGDTTDTVTSQRGTVRFQLSATLDTETSLSNVQSYLEKWGLDMSGADEDQAETVYWRQMFRRVIDSNVAGAPAGVQKARQKLIDMKSQLQSSTNVYFDNDRDIVEAVGVANPEGEAEFWRSLAYEAFGADKVNSFIADGKHLPQYQHMDMTDPEKKTGLPYYNRIDVDMSEVYAQGTMIAIGNNGKDDRHFDYIKSGGMVSTEERLRILGYYKTGASSSEDQNTGGANSVFSRVATGGADKSGAIYGAHVAYWSPAVMQHIGTYSFPGDQFGNISNQADNNPYNPMDALKNHTGGGNETMVSNTLSILDYLEIMVFEDEKKRLQAIEEMKKLGILLLRGVPIEDRLVLRSNLEKAKQKVKAAWK